MATTNINDKACYKAFKIFILDKNLIDFKHVATKKDQNQPKICPYFLETLKTIHYRADLSSY